MDAMNNQTSLELKKLHEIGINISILYVEDEKKLREEMAIYLGKLFPNLRVAADGEEGLRFYKQSPADIVISDILMPKLSGIEMLRTIKEINPHQEMIITSAYTESDYFIDAIKLGIDAYIIKPVEHTQIIEILYKSALEITHMRENEEYRRHLEALVETKVAAYKELEEEKMLNYEQTLLGLIKMIERRDSYTAGHSQRVAHYSKIIAESMGYSQAQCDLVNRAGILHDIGKIATPDTILLKPGKLDVIERELIQLHVNVGTEMLSEIPMFTEITDIIAAHHEHYDGSGYPKGLKGAQIHELSQIMIVADAFDAMTTNRIYKPRKSVAEAIEEIRAYAGIQFDPNVVENGLETLSNIEVENTITQLPSNALEEERFAYFYKDRVSSLYNQRYLDVVLLKNSYSQFYRCINIFSLHRFNEYNDHYGWEKGNELLFSFANIIKERFYGGLLFRIHANDFIVLSQNHIDIPNCEDKLAMELLGDQLECSHFHIDMTVDEIVTLNDLEKRMRDERYHRKHATFE